MTGVQTCALPISDFEKEVGYDYIFTQSLRKVIDNNDILFIYWIMDFNKRVDHYAPDDYTSGVKFIERGYTDEDGSITRQVEMRNRIDMSIGLLMDQYDKWEARPDPSLCKDCPVSELWGGPCKKYVEQTII